MYKIYKMWLRYELTTKPTLSTNFLYFVPSVTHMTNTSPIFESSSINSTTPLATSTTLLENRKYWYESVQDSVSGCLSVCLSVCLSICLSVYLSDCPTVSLSVLVSVRLLVHICLSAFLSIPPSVTILSAHVCLTVCLSVWLTAIGQGNILQNKVKRNKPQPVGLHNAREGVYLLHVGGCGSLEGHINSTLSPSHVS